MAIRGVFKAGSLLSGLGSTGTKLKEVQQRSKSTTTEMKRMTSGANALKGALAAIGVAGFSALLLTTPQLAGSLAKIKSEMQRIAWSIGKHLKPALDAVATILRGIRTGDWSTVKQGVKDLADSLLTLADKAITVTVDTIFGEGTAEQTKKDFNNWISELETMWDNRDLPGLMWDNRDLPGLIKVGLWEPIAWAGEKLADFQQQQIKDLQGEKGAAKGKWMREAIWGTMETIGEFATGTPSKPEYGSYQTGGYVPRTGMYKLHAGETVTMQGSSPPEGSGGSTEINIDFSGANINLASGIELDQFANAISNQIAERQNSLTY
jgi:hypothetical protein